MRCHDAIGLGFDDRGIALCDYDPLSHRKFLIDYFTSRFADYNNRELLEVANPHLFAFGRYNLAKPSERVLVITNFHGKPQHLALEDIGTWPPPFGQMVDLCSGKRPEAFNGSLVIPGFGFYWLNET